MSIEEKWRNINPAYLQPQAQAIKPLLEYLADYQAEPIIQKTRELILEIRQKPDNANVIEAFLQTYQLNSAEGKVLMSLAEAILRIPDQATQTQLLSEKLQAVDWLADLPDDSLWWIHSAANLLSTYSKPTDHPPVANILANLDKRLGLPLMRQAVLHGIQLLAEHFILAESLPNALKQIGHDQTWRYSFDMLGEAALTSADEQRYQQAYLQAIQALADTHQNQTMLEKPGISIKLSALCATYHPIHQNQALQKLRSSVLQLAQAAKQANINLTLDAEESHRLAMSLQLFAGLRRDERLAGWNGLGLAVQAYQKRAWPVLHWLTELAAQTSSRIPIRLVKGAYWDSEIKWAQQQGLSNYPVFTDKTATDLSYLACAKWLLQHPEQFYPQIATHNAHTLSAIQHMGAQQQYEFQRLQGMGAELYQHDSIAQPCRIYAPIGQFHDLLPYLVRRLLENGANNSFVHNLANPNIDAEALSEDPVRLIRSKQWKAQPLALPGEIFSPRKNSAGLNLADLDLLQQLQYKLKSNEKQYACFPLIGKETTFGDKQPVFTLANQLPLGTVQETTQEQIKSAIDIAALAFPAWRLSTLTSRCEYLYKMANLLDENRLEIISICIREAGKTLTDADSEIREAIDFCRYYAQSALQLLSSDSSLPSPTGEENQFHYHGRGVMICISPWNFPVAIFIGQIAAALVAGNCVIAKPSEHTPITAFFCSRLFYQSGIPENVLQLTPGQGNSVGCSLLNDGRIAGVLFTGSCATAQSIHQQIARFPKIIPIIAETGGLNVLIADNSAHPQQLVEDVIQSAFNSAGQRCSALRILCLPNDLAERLLPLLIGATEQLTIGNPVEINVDIGPLISPKAVKQLKKHVAKFRKDNQILYQYPLAENLSAQRYFPPTIIELTQLQQLQAEQFGPILHVFRYQPDELPELLQHINAMQFGLTMGIHSRIQKNIDYICRHSQIGNIYVNRNMVGAVVESQPFGGTGLSGTGPKAGGVNYLRRLCNEQAISINTAAVGGNLNLLCKNNST